MVFSLASLCAKYAISLILRIRQSSLGKVLAFSKATRVKTVNIFLVNIRAKNTRLSVDIFFSYCLLRQTGALVGVNLFDA